MSFKFWAAVSIKHRGVWDSWLFCHHQCLAWIHLDPSSILRPPVCHYKCHVICNMKKKNMMNLVFVLHVNIVLSYFNDRKKVKKKKTSMRLLRGHFFSLFSGFEMPYFKIQRHFESDLGHSPIPTSFFLLFPVNTILY